MPEHEHAILSTPHTVNMFCIQVVFPLSFYFFLCRCHFDLLLFDWPQTFGWVKTWLGISKLISVFWEMEKKMRWRICLYVCWNANGAEWVLKFHHHKSREFDECFENVMSIILAATLKSIWMNCLLQWSERGLWTY